MHRTRYKTSIITYDYDVCDRYIDRLCDYETDIYDDVYSAYGVNDTVSAHSSDYTNDVSHDTKIGAIIDTHGRLVDTLLI